MDGNKRPDKNEQKKAIAKINLTIAIICLLTELVRKYDTLQVLFS